MASFAKGPDWEKSQTGTVVWQGVAVRYSRRSSQGAGKVEKLLLQRLGKTYCSVFQVFNDIENLLLQRFSTFPAPWEDLLLQRTAAPCHTTVPVWDFSQSGPLANEAYMLP
jgi:hypothetical protein